MHNVAQTIVLKIIESRDVSGPDTDTALREQGKAENLRKYGEGCMDRKSDTAGKAAETFESSADKQCFGGVGMQYTTICLSPLGEILLAADAEGLTGLWFTGAKYYGRGLGRRHEEKNVPVFEEARRWLHIYFSGKEPDFTPQLHLLGTPFQMEVWKVLRQIPYGETTTYGRIAKRIAEERGLPGMSAQAVGGAVGHNPVSVIIPCHRVVGADGKLIGYAGGIDRKVRLLMLEGRKK